MSRPPSLSLLCPCPAQFVVVSRADPEFLLIIREARAQRGRARRRGRELSRAASASASFINLHPCISCRERRKREKEEAAARDHPSSMTRRRRTERDREGAKTTKTAAPTETKGGSAAHVNNITHRPAGGAESGANTLTPLLEAATAAATLLRIHQPRSSVLRTHASTIKS
jgi:hypothetical protein